MVRVIPDLQRRTIAINIICPPKKSSICISVGHKKLTQIGQKTKTWLLQPAEAKELIEVLQTMQDDKVSQRAHNQVQTHTQSRLQKELKMIKAKMKHAQKFVGERSFFCFFFSITPCRVQYVYKAFAVDIYFVEALQLLA